MSKHDLMHESVEAQRDVIRAVYDETLSELLGTEITMAQMKALAVMERQPGCTIGMLSEQLGVKAPAASLLVDKLVRSGLAYRVRDTEDGRRVIVRPTMKGADVVGRLRHGSRSVLGRWVGQLAEGDLAALHRGLTALASIARGFPLESAAPVVR